MSRKRFWRRRRLDQLPLQPVSLMELRRVHRRLRRWGRDLPYEEFAGWRLDREAPRRTWQEVHRRQRRVLMAGAVAATVLAFAMTNPMAGFDQLTARLPQPAVMFVGMLDGIAVASTRVLDAALDAVHPGALPGGQPPSAQERRGEWAPQPSAPEAPNASPSPPAADETPSVTPPTKQEATATDIASGEQPLGERGEGVDAAPLGGEERPPVTIASVEANALARHGATATAIVAGKVAEVVGDAVVLRVELVLKGDVAEGMYITVPAADDALLHLQPGSRLLAYLTELEEEATPSPDDASAAMLRQAGRGALIELSQLSSPQR